MQKAHAIITDTSDKLIVPAGETYILNGNHTYAQSVEIYGTVNVRPYDGGSNNGWLEIHAPQAVIGTGAQINATGCGYRAAEGPGRGSGGGYGDAGGGAYGGNGGNSSYTDFKGGACYGNIASPDDFGSGGGNGRNTGGSGGGKVKIYINGTLTIDGSITSNGAQGYYYSGNGGGGGSGGAILLQCASLAGSGLIEASGGIGGADGAGGGGGGRIALYYQSSSFSGQVKALGNVGGAGSRSYSFGGAGTVYRNSSALAFEELSIDNGQRTGGYTVVNGMFDRLVVQNGGTGAASGILTVNSLLTDYGGIFINSGTVNITNLTLINGSTFYQESGIVSVSYMTEVGSGTVVCLDAPFKTTNMHVASKGILTHATGKSGFDLTVTGDLTIDAGGRIDANGKGFGPGQGPGRGAGAGYGNAGGGAYGGKGGDASDGSFKGGTACGSMTCPEEQGSGGGNGRNTGGSGGGKIKITSNGTFTNNGTICADGTDGLYYSGNGGGGGSGGSVFLIVNSLSGSGLIEVNGGKGGADGAGGGSGGRIAIYYQSNNFSGQITALGKGGVSQSTIGEQGTVFTTQLGANSPVSICNLAENISRSSQLSESVSIQDISMNNSVFQNKSGISGSIVFLNFKKIDIKSGAFSGQGFFKSDAVVTIGASAYNCKWKGMAYLDRTNKAMRLQGCIDGQAIGAIEIDCNESVVGSGNYDVYSGTLSVTQLNNQLATDKIILGGNVAYGANNTLSNVPLSNVQVNVTGKASGYYSGNLSLMLNCVKINDTSSPYYQEGFALISYNSDQGPGQVYAYAQKGTITTMGGIMTGQINGYISSSLNENLTPKGLSFLIFRFNYGEQVQEYLETYINGPESASPGQTITFTVELKNTGLNQLINKSLVVYLPQRSQYVSASGTHQSYHLGDWDENGKLYRAYAVRWDLPSISAKSSQIFSCQTRMQWGLTQEGIYKCNVFILSKEDADQIFPTYVTEGDHD